MAHRYPGFESEPFSDAVREYVYLLDRGYPSGSTLALVADRRRLDTIQRTALYRGVFDTPSGRGRRALLITRLRPGVLHADGHNVLFTIANYLLGRPLFIATDGLLRDTGEAFPHRPSEEKMGEALDILLVWLTASFSGALDVRLDGPVDGARGLGRSFDEAFRRLGIHGTITAEGSADRFLERAQSGALASSDSKVIDRCRLPVFDLARSVLEGKFSPEFIDFGEIWRNPVS